MSSKTKILLLKKRECLYTLILVALAVILILLMVLMFQPAASKSERTVSYAPGMYTSQIALQDTVMDVTVRADSSGIHSIALTNITSAVSAMYPSVQPSLDKLARQICDTQSLENIYYEKSNQYTSQMLLQAIRSALDLAGSVSS